MSSPESLTISPGLFRSLMNNQIRSVGFGRDVIIYYKLFWSTNAHYGKIMGEQQLKICFCTCAHLNRTINNKKKDRQASWRFNLIDLATIFEHLSSSKMLLMDSFCCNIHLITTTKAITIVDLVLSLTSLDLMYFYPPFLISTFVSAVCVCAFFMMRRPTAPSTEARST